VTPCHDETAERQVVHSLTEPLTRVIHSVGLVIHRAYRSSTITQRGMPITVTAAKE
jgi:hypothetical protein